jgi:hypothetical protein
MIITSNSMKYGYSHAFLGNWKTTHHTDTPRIYFYDKLKIKMNSPQTHTHTHPHTHRHVHRK